MQMKPMLLSFVALLMAGAASAQGTSILMPLDHKGEPPSASLAYFRNDNQVTDLNGTPLDAVRYYSWSAYPRVAAKKESTIALHLDKIDTMPGAPDSVYAISLRPVGEMAHAVDPVALEEISERHNFFLAHCPNGILNVPGYKRLVYKEIFPKVDLHLYSNPYGLKLYLVLLPGADPDDVRFQFSGQDSIRFDYMGALRAYLQDRYIVLPEALAYQQVNGGTELVSWGLDYALLNNADQIRFEFGEYNAEHPLILDISASLGGQMSFGLPPEWGTYFGQSSNDNGTDILMRNDGSQFVCGTTSSPSFPITPSAFQYQAGSESFFSQFNTQYSRKFCTFYGGLENEITSTIAFTPDQQSLYLLGSSWGNDLQTMGPSGSFVDDSSDGQFSSPFIVRFGLGTDTVWVEWMTYFGGANTRASTMATDAQGNLYIAGHVTWEGFAGEATCQGSDGTFPYCNAIGASAYYQDFMGGGSFDGFIAKFNPQFELVHSTLFGGADRDAVYSIAVDNSLGQVFFTGHTLSRRQTYTNCQPTSPGGSFPLCDPGSGYFQDDLNWTNSTVDAYRLEGIVGSFSTTTGALTWSSFVGSQHDDVGNRVAVDEAHHKVYVAGFTSADYYASNACDVPANAGFPGCFSGGQFHADPAGGYYDVSIMKFDGVTHALEWSTMMGGGGKEAATALSVTTAETGDAHVVVGASTNSGVGGAAGIPTWYNPVYYFQSEHADHAVADTNRTDAFVWVFNGDDERELATYAGGLGSEDIRDVVSAAGERLYLTGLSYSTADFPFNCPSTVDPWCDQSYLNTMLGTSDVIHMQIQYDETVGYEEPLSLGHDQWYLYPNPATGQVWINTPLDHRPADLAVEVYDGTGRLVQRLRPAGPSTARTLGLDVGWLNPGYWMLRITAPSIQLARSIALLRE